ncbi:MAG: hypothetical protein WC592_07200 [Candidatus Omnitrophota bacterium]
MKVKNLAGIIVAVAATLILAVPVFSQDASPEQPDVMPAAAIAGEGAGQPNDISIYGEVMATDPATNSVSVQYYDYDMDEEKTISVELDKDTKIENASDLSGIKQGNWADIIYAVKDGKNVAVSVVIEKEEEAPLEASTENEEDY